MNLVNEIPELNIAITSVLLASFDVNQITDKKRNIGNKEYFRKIPSKIRCSNLKSALRWHLKFSLNLSIFSAISTIIPIGINNNNHY